MAWVIHPAARYRDKAALVRQKAILTGRMKGSALVLVLAVALTGCDGFGTTRPVAPKSAPQNTVTPTPVPRSAESEALARYYTALQNDLLTRGLLRTDGGGPDTEFTADSLARNFEAIALYDEYSPAASQPLNSVGGSSQLSRWARPVRVSTQFGPSVSIAQRLKDQADISRYVTRLARVTGHPINTTGTNGNFHVFVAGEDDSAFVQARLKQLVPTIKQSVVDQFTSLPRSQYCIVYAFSSSHATQTFTVAIALIRAEHPDLVRLSCIHEEIAQGLGLSNDSPYARPSIFNDDDEFALLTSHDELLLKMLYDPRLKPGMTADQARPMVRIIAYELMGQEL